jgi:hypothetical protein
MEKEKKRTPQQNRAMHLAFKLLADRLNDAGFDMKKTLKPEIAIPWTEESIKEHLWRPVQIALFNKQSTAELTTKEIDPIYETLIKFLAQKHLIDGVPFPSIEEIIFQQNYEKNK